MSRTSYLLFATILFAGACRVAPEPLPEVRPEALPTISLKAVLDDIRERCRINVLANEALLREKVRWTRPEGDSASIYWREDLYGVADQVFADVWPLGGTTFALVPFGPVTMEFEWGSEGGDARMLMDIALSQVGGSFLWVRTDTGVVDLNVKNVPLRRVIDTIAHEAKLVVVRDRGLIYRLSTPEHERRISTRPLPTETLNALGLGFSGKDHGGTISISAVGVQASLLLEQISKVAGIPISIEEGLDRPVTLELIEAPWREATEAIAWKTGGGVWDEGRGAIVIRSLPRLSIHTMDAHVRIVLEIIAESAGIPLEVADNLDGGCGMSIHAAPWRDALYSLSRKHPFHLRVKPDGTFVAEAF